MSSFDDDRRAALRALRDCEVIRVTLGKVPRGYRLLQVEGAIRARGAPMVAGGTSFADCRLTEKGRRLAERELR